jgi:hypothetical protein
MSSTLPQNLPSPGSLQKGPLTYMLKTECSCTFAMQKSYLEYVGEFVRAGMTSVNRSIAPGIKFTKVLFLVNFIQEICSGTEF